MIYKRKGSPYWYFRTEKDGETIRESTGTIDRKQAKVYAAKRQSELYAQKRLGECHYTLADAVARWTKEKASKRSLARDREILSRIPHGEALLADFSANLVRDHLERLSAATSPANANRHRACIVALLNAAKGWGWVTDVPMLKPFKVERTEPRWLTRGEFDKLLGELPAHICPIARFAVATGLRYGNIAGFRWEWVKEGVGYVPAASAKAGRVIPVPLNTEARAILEAQQGRHPHYVFVDHLGHAPIGSVKTAWGKAVKRAGLDGLRFHELRHTWASWHLQNGTPLHILQKLGGWTDHKMLLNVYGHLATADLARYANNV